MKLIVPALFGSILLAGACRVRDSADLHRFLSGVYAADRELAADLRYQSAFVDLDGDGRDEAVVRLIGRHFCGSGGCRMHVLKHEAQGWREIAQTTITWPPVRVLHTRTHGWSDLAVKLSGGGIMPGYEARMPFDGRSYPLNPSVPPAEPLRRGTPGRVLISEADEGRLLFD